jgi:hypothetical protein
VLLILVHVPARDRRLETMTVGIASVLTKLLRNHQNGYASATDNAVGEV